MAARARRHPPLRGGARRAAAADPPARGRLIRATAVLSLASLVPALFALSCGRSGRVVVFDEAEAARVASLDAELEPLARALGFPEGPLWIADSSAPAGGFLLFSDLWGDRLLRYEPGGGVSVFEEGLGAPNGNALLPDGSLLTCEHDRRRIRRRAADGTISTFADRWAGGRLNSPNDLVVGPDGSVWFTDPRYGRPDGRSDYGGDYVFRLAPGDRLPRPVVTELDRPNGIGLSPDGRTLYVADSGRPRALFAFPLAADGTVGEGRVLHRAEVGVPDGLAVDEDGRIFLACGDGVRVLDPDGRPILLIPSPEPLTNVAFGGPEGRILYCTGRSALFAVGLLASGDR